MSSLSATLNIAKSALLTQQYGLSVTGNNISNVNNEDYSLQRAVQSSTGTVNAGGNTYGTGVTVQDVNQSVNQLLENRLTGETSSQAAYEEATSYIQIVEAYFDQSSDTSLSNLLDNFWDAWDDLADNPTGSSERGIVYEQGQLLTDQVNTLSSQLTSLAQQLSGEIISGVSSINSLADQIATLNGKVNTAESSGNANYLIDQRNALIDDLAELIDVQVINEGDGDVSITTAGGVPLVSSMESYSLRYSENKVRWIGSSGNAVDITDKISSGKLGGWLSIRDESIPTYQTELNELASSTIWAVNLVQSEGAGLSYYNGTLTGTYSVDESGWLSSLAFGDRIDSSGDVTVWVGDTSTSDTDYERYSVDMGVSDADIGNWDGTAPYGDSVTYEFTVVDSGSIGDKVVSETSGANLGEIHDTTSGDVSDVLDSILADQTLTVYNTNAGTVAIDVGDSASDAIRSAASIAEALNAVDGVEAFASPTGAQFDISGITNAEEGDTIKYTLYVDGMEYEKSFVVDGSGDLAGQFETSLKESVQAINLLNEDSDLYADGLVLTSDKGATLGIQDFEVQDNTGLQLDTFNDFDTGDVLTLTIDTQGAVPTSTTTISIDLSAVGDPTDQEAMSEVFYAALSAGLPSDTFSVELDRTNNAVIIRTLDGSDIVLRNADGDTGATTATVAVSSLGGSSSGIGNGSLAFDGTDQEGVTADSLGTDTLGFHLVSSTSGAGASSVLNETTYTGAGGTTAAAIMGSVTIITDEDIVIASDELSGLGLFGSSGAATTGTSILTMGGTDGFENWDTNDTISFDVDGTSISIVVGGDTSDYALAGQLYNALSTSTLPSDQYTIIRNGTSVSIVKNSALDEEDPIEVTNFADDNTSGTGNAAQLSVSTGAGEGTNDPGNTTLVSGNAYKNATTSSLYDDEAIISWAKRDPSGLLTGESGTVTVSEEGRVTLVENGVETISFDVSAGDLVAGNTLSINTDDNGKVDPLDFTVRNQANSVNDTYTFNVSSGGTLGEDPRENPIVIQWSNSMTSGTIEFDADEKFPVSVEVDGMTLRFFSGTLMKDDAFTVTTDDTGLATSTNTEGKPTGETEADWHWTMDSFADQFNRDVGGVKATVNGHNQLVLSSSDEFHVIDNTEYSGSHGFSPDNVSIEVLNHDALDFSAADLQFARRDDGTWAIVNDRTGGVAQLIPPAGDDSGFKVDLNGDGVGDIAIQFNRDITGEGYVEFDLVPKQEADLSYAFGDDKSVSSGFLAAAGINTFFEGYNADSMAVNERLEEGTYIAAGVIDSNSGEISEGDNRNAVALAELQNQTMGIREWTFTRGAAASSSITDTTLNGYHNAIVSSLGLEASSNQASLDYAKLLVSQLTEQRNAVSAVSLDEEMVNLIKYQQAYSAASQLLTTTDQMLDELLSIR